MRVWLLGWLQLWYFCPFLYVEWLRLWSLCIVRWTIFIATVLIISSLPNHKQSWYLALTGYMVAVVSPGVVSPGLFSMFGTTTFQCSELISDNGAVEIVCRPLKKHSRFFVQNSMHKRRGKHQNTPRWTWIKLSKTPRGTCMLPERNNPLKYPHLDILVWVSS